MACLIPYFASTASRNFKKSALDQVPKASMIPQALWSVYGAATQAGFDRDSRENIGHTLGWLHQSYWISM